MLLLCLLSLDPVRSEAAEEPAQPALKPALRLCAAIESPWLHPPEAGQPGLVPEVFSRAAEQTGIELEWQTLSWPLAVQGVRDGHFDAVVGAPLHLVEGLRVVDPPLWRSSLEVFTPERGDKAESSRLGIIDGFDTEENLRAVRSTMDRGEGEMLVSRGHAPVQSLVRWAAEGRIDTLVVPADVAEATKQQVGLDSFVLKRVGEPGGKIPRVLAFAPRADPALAKRLASHIDELLAGPFHDHLKEKYGLSAEIGHSEPAERTDRLVILAEAYPPAIIQTAGGASGFAADLVGEIVARVHEGDMPPAEAIRVVEWAEGYRRVQGEGYVALFPTARTPQREDLFHWAGPLFEEEVGLYALAERDMGIHVLEDARWVKRIGTVADSYKTTLLKKRGFDNLISVRGQSAHARNLARGWIDLWVTSDIGMAYQARKAGVDPSRIERVYTVREATHYIAFSKPTPRRVVEAWQTALDALRREGRVEALRRRGLDDQQEPRGGAR
jgi:polar amino acid transport system substrate-binding protein